MPIATFELLVEIDAEYNVVNYGYKGDRGEPASGPEIDVSSVSINGIRVFPKAKEAELRAEFDEATKEFVYEHFEDLEEQNAPDPD
tara:strand:+ start:63 stop:320 length:258 start_codon:yes stop_codon:yes gene_type:complete